MRFQGLLESNGYDGAFFFLLELRVRGEGGVKFNGFQSFSRRVILGEAVNCEDAWAFPRSVIVIMKVESLLS